MLALGGQIKAAICLTGSGQALLSHHLGELDAALGWEAFLKAIADYTALFDHRPACIACDAHPGYRTTQHAQGMGLPVVAVQHHHAHLAACLAENLWPRDAGRVAGIILDGTGYGADGTVWGGEVLLGDYDGIQRVAHLAPAPLPGGDRAARQPWRNLLMRLDQAGLADIADRWLGDFPRDPVRAAAQAGVNAPMVPRPGGCLTRWRPRWGYAGPRRASKARRRCGWRRWPRTRPRRPIRLPETGPPSTPRR